MNFPGPTSASHCSFASFMMNRALLALLLALSALVPAGQCDAPAQRSSRSTSGTLSTCSFNCNHAGAVWAADSTLAPPRSGSPAAEALPRPTGGAQTEIWTSTHGIHLVLMVAVAGAAGAACGAATLLLVQRAQLQRRRRQARCRQQQQQQQRQQQQQQQPRRIRMPPPSQALSPWAHRRASLAVDRLSAVAAKRPPLPPARRHSLPAGLMGGVHLDSGIIARVSSDAPSLSLGSPFAPSAAQPGRRSCSQSTAPGRPAGLPPVGAAACTAAAELATAGAPSAMTARRSFGLLGSERSLSSGCPNPLEGPAYSPSVRPSLEGCTTPSPPSRLSSAHLRPSMSNLPSIGADKAVLRASDSLAERYSKALPDACLPAAAPSQAEQLAAEPGAPLPASLPGPLRAGALPDALRRCLVHPSEISFLHWPDEPLQQLGEGASATVFRARFRGQAVAVKVMHVGHSAEAQKIFTTEAVRMEQLRHDHIVNFLGISLDGPNAMLIMEYCEGHDLLGSLQVLAGDGSGRRLFGWWHRGRRVALQLAEAVAHLHSLGIVHMDVKSSNVLLTARGAAKLGDVGLSRLLERTHLSAVTCIGTFAWAAPEVLLGGHDCGRPADIYSYGVVLWELLTGERPVRGHLRLPRVPEECPQEVADLMLRCLSTDPGARPTAAQLVTQLEALVFFGATPAPAAPCPAPE